MALRVEETEFLNRIDQALSKNLNSMKDQFNAILDDKSVQNLLEISQNIQTMQDNLLYYQVFAFFTIALAIWYCYEILTGRFVERLYTNIYQSIMKKFDSTIKEQEKHMHNLDNLLERQIETIKHTHQLLYSQNQISSSILESLRTFKNELHSLSAENMRLHSELMKTKNILRKKIKKGGENNEG